MPTQKTFKYQGEDRAMMVRDDEDAKVSLKEAQTQLREGVSHIQKMFSRF